jgi:UDPglucose 6-dehydrogenase
MKDIKIGVVGIGFVGNSLVEAYKIWGVKSIYTFDINKECNCSSLEDLVSKSDYIFICLPTPTTNGEPNFKIVLNACLEINLICKEAGLTKTVLVKSTTVPEVMREISVNCENIILLSNPEFLTERTALEDTLNPSRVVYGCDDKNYANEVSQILSYQFLKNKTKYFITGLETAMKIKYASNSFGAYKVLFFNIIHEWSDNHEEFEEIREGMLASGWVNTMHTVVPHNGSFGYGGNCLVKDLVAFSKSLEKSGFKDEADYFMKCDSINSKIKKINKLNL